ncbi:MAG: AAA family ATPase [Gammaproteobacteria bacterium]|nr:AAA family ATPase [Gammaproteobacteria bacterium]
MTSHLQLERTVAEQRIIICCGSGGVGKTTTGAALGVLAARQGRSALVMTIDPAHRLAQAMGLAALGHEPEPVAVDAPGSLAAMMLDTKRTFDKLVEQYAPSSQVREAIFANEYYRQLSSSLGGSRELVAMERVLEAVNEEGYDLLIVDTPPAHHALDFLDAPGRLIDLIDGSLTSMLVKPYGLAARAQFNLFRQSSAMTLKFMERLTGFEMLADLSEFLLAFSSMFDGFKERSHRVMELMREPSTTFLLICAPEESSLQQVGQFQARLRGENLGIAGVLVNRVHVCDPEAGDLDGGALSTLSQMTVEGRPLAGLVDRVEAAYAEHRILGAADARAMQGLMGGDLPVRTVPHFRRDLHSMFDLEAFAEVLG